MSKGLGRAQRRLLTSISVIDEVQNGDVSRMCTEDFAPWSAESSYHSQIAQITRSSANAGMSDPSTVIPRDLESMALAAQQKDGAADLAAFGIVNANVLVHSGPLA